MKLTSVGVCLTVFLVQESWTHQHQEMLKQSLRVKNIKHWLSYVDQILSKGLTLTFVPDSTRHSALSNTRIFENYIVAQIIAFWHTASDLKPTGQAPCFALDMREIYFMKRSTTPKLILGVISEVGLTGEFYSSFYKATCWGIVVLVQKWYFRLHEMLHLNMTFYKLKIEMGQLYSCSLGSISVYIWQNKRTKRRLQFCGSYSDLPIYYHQNQFTLALKANRFVFFDILFQYMVMDSGVLSSIALPKQLPSAIRSPWYIKYRGIARQLMHFTLHCLKYQVLHLQFPLPDHSNTVSVFNGQGSKFLPVVCFLRSSKYPMHCVTSTFLATVYVTKSVGHHLKLKFEQSLKEKNITGNLSAPLSTSLVVQSSPELSSPGCLISDISCVWQLSTLTPHILNVTLSSKRKTNESNTCQFGCMSVFDQSPNATFEIYEICPSHQSQQDSQPRSVYSSAEKGKLVFHIHNGHCEQFVMHLLVSSSICTLLRVNLCETSEAPLTIQMNQIKPNSTECHVIQPFYNLPESKFKSKTKQARRDARFAETSLCKTAFQLSLTSALVQGINFKGHFHQGMYTFE